MIGLFHTIVSMCGILSLGIVLIIPNESGNFFGRLNELVSNRIIFWCMVFGFAGFALGGFLIDLDHGWNIRCLWDGFLHAHSLRIAGCEYMARGILHKPLVMISIIFLGAGSSIGCLINMIYKRLPQLSTVLFSFSSSISIALFFHMLMDHFTKFLVV